MIKQSEKQYRLMNTTEFLNMQSLNESQENTLEKAY